MDVCIHITPSFILAGCLPNRGAFCVELTRALFPCANAGGGLHRGCSHREDDGLVACIVSLDLVGVNSETADDLRSAAQGAVSKIMQVIALFMIEYLHQSEY